MIKQGLTSLSSLEPLFEMMQRCEKFDGYPAKFYWNLVESRRYDPQALDYLYFDSSAASANPVALLSAYYFQDGIEITAMVDPDFRRRGIFNQLIEKVFDILRLYHINSYFLVCHAKATTFNAKCIAEGGKLDHSEIEMQAPPFFTYFPKQVVALQRATQADLPLLMKLHEACFPGASLSSIENRLLLMLKESHRQTWIAKNLAGKPVGKLHVREDTNAVFLHDLGIIPEFQQQGYARSLIHYWYQQYIFPPNKPLLIDVLSDNHAAIRLYTAIGFTVTNQYNFWQFDVPKANAF